MFTLRLLGGFALLDARGEPVRGLSQRRAEAVLALLALANDLGCTRDRLISLLWPESDAPHARHNLRSALHALRTSAGQEIVLGSGETVRLNASLVATDVGEFNRALADARLPEAVDAYGGALLDGFHLDEAPEFERFIEEERARFYRRCSDALESLAAAAERAGEWRAAVSWRQRAVAHDPHNSRIVILLMRAMAKEGDPANALLQADVHRRRLWKDLEIEPDDELEAESNRIRETLHNHAVPHRASGRPSTALAAFAPAAVPSAGAGPPDGLASPASTPPWSNPLARSPASEPSPAPAISGAVAREERGPWRPRRRHVILAVALVLLGIGTAVLWRASPAEVKVLDPDGVAIVPFTSGGQPRVTTESEAIRSFIVRQLQSGPAPNAIDPAAVDHAWSAAQSVDAGDPLAQDAVVARHTGASLVLRGRIDSTIAGRTLTLTLSRFPAHRVEAKRSVTLDHGDQTAALHRLLIEVLALEAGEPDHRIAALGSHPLAAVRPYFEHIRRREAKQECHAVARDAWRIDSTLVYPGLICLAMDGFYVGSHAFLDTIAFTVWRRRSGLPSEDSAYVDALVGPWFGRADNAEQRIALWRGAANAAPLWWVPWASLAREWVMFGARTTLMEWPRDAVRANERALELSRWSQEGPVEMAFWLGIFRGDSAASRRALVASERFDVVEPQRIHTATNYYWWGTKPWPWIYNAAFGDGHLVVPPEVPLDSLMNRVRLLRVLTQARPGTTKYLDSLLLRWEREHGRAAGIWSDWWIAAHWRTRGDYARWRAAWNRMNARSFRTTWPEYNRIAADVANGFYEVLHQGAPEDTVFRLRLARMQRVLADDIRPLPPPGPIGIAACWVSLWRLSHGDTTGVGRAIRVLRALDARDRSGAADGLPTSGRWIRCPALLEAHRARVTGRGALEAARAYDRLLQPLPVPRRGWWFFVTAGNEDNVAVYNESLDAAWLLAAAGDTAAALAAVRRRPRWAALMLDFHFTPTQHLRLEGRLAATMTDTLGAIAAYEGYLALRPTPPAHPPWRAEWDSVRAELARMKKPRP